MKESAADYTGAVGPRPQRLVPSGRAASEYLLDFSNTRPARCSLVGFVCWEDHTLTVPAPIRSGPATSLHLRPATSFTFTDWFRPHLAAAAGHVSKLNWFRETEANSRRRITL